VSKRERIDDIRSHERCTTVSALRYTNKHRGRVCTRARHVLQIASFAGSEHWQKNGKRCHGVPGFENGSVVALPARFHFDPIP